MVQEAKMDIFMCSICSLLSIICAVGFCLSIAVDFQGREKWLAHTALSSSLSTTPLKSLWNFYGTNHPACSSTLLSGLVSAQLQA